MSTGIIILAVAAAVIVALVLARPVPQSSGGGLRRRFGPEHDRAVSRHDGDVKAAQRELSERLRRYGDLQPQCLTTQAREWYIAQWAYFQEQFANSPAQALADADQLLGRVAADRGYPAESHEQQIDALSVRHPHHVDGYRRLHTVAQRAGAGQAETEEMREALVGARGLFEELAKRQPYDDGPTSESHRMRVPSQRRGASWERGTDSPGRPGRLGPAH
jgi:hypothetical protein